MNAHFKHRTDDERIADERIIPHGLPFLHKHYQGWPRVLSRTSYTLSDPYRCILCVLETGRAIALRDDVPLKEVDPRRIEATIDYGFGVTFKEVLERQHLPFEDAVACGFARGHSDPQTFYATLRDRWRLHVREQPGLPL